MVFVKIQGSSSRLTLSLYDYIYWKSTSKTQFSNIEPFSVIVTLLGKAGREGRNGGPGPAGPAGNNFWNLLDIYTMNITSNIYTFNTNQETMARKAVANTVQVNQIKCPFSHQFDFNYVKFSEPRTPPGYFAGAGAGGGGGGLNFNS